jgi:hypothetical protein
MEVSKLSKNNLFLGFALILPCALFSQKWFLNDASQKGDVFTSAIGKSSNSGKSSDVPCNSLSHIFLNAKKGDTVFIDNGSYPEISTNGSILIPIPDGVTIVFPETSLFEKNNLPDNIKATAEEFYILNDKPVSREEYLKAKSKL